MADLEVTQAPAIDVDAELADMEGSGPSFDVEAEQKEQAADAEQHNEKLLSAELVYSAEQSQELVIMITNRAVTPTGDLMINRGEKDPKEGPQYIRMLQELLNASEVPSHKIVVDGHFSFRQNYSDYITEDAIKAAQRELGCNVVEPVAAARQTFSALIAATLANGSLVFEDPDLHERWETARPLIQALGQKRGGDLRHQNSAHDKGDEPEQRVAAVEEMLETLGYEADYDGIKQFQGDHGVRQTGNVGINTSRELIKAYVGGV